ncbi:hypothetical protein AOQ84DRAFT_353649 [Glonium stellatum]|uniref:Uncharacterized protein n=1 Tax=Glonium stellatum TaxID=574774 RepID=A0A8E2JUZ6_9PEZI|nr:hypothetical protein AOQ84DRAFT_353649 [Glonium stellatum]
MQCSGGHDGDGDDDDNGGGDGGGLSCIALDRRGKRAACKDLQLRACFKGWESLG